MKQITKNYIFSILYQMLNIILPLITTPYVSRVLDVSGVGRNSYVLSIVNYYSLFVILGTYTYGQREIGASQKDKNRYTDVFCNIFLLKIILGIIVLGVYIATVPLYAGNLKPLFIVRILTLLANIIDTSWFFQGMENFKVTVTRQMCVRIFGAIGVFALVKNENDLVLYALIDSVLAFIGNISIIPYLRKYISLFSIVKKIGQNKITINLKKYFFGTMSLFFPQIATSLYMSIDKSMIGFFYRDGAEGGYYEQATKIYMMGLTVVIALTNVLIPRLSLYHQEADKDKASEILHNAITYIFFVGAPLATGISAIGFNLLPWFLGSNFNDACVILQVTSFLILVMGITNLLGYGYLVSMRQQNKYTSTVVFGTIFNICINYCLIPAFGAVGAAVASVFSELVVFVFQYIIVNRQIPLLEMFIENTKYLFYSIIMYSITLYMSKNMNASIKNTFIVIIVGVAAYISLLLVTKDKYLFKVVNILHNKIRGK